MEKSELETVKLLSRWDGVWIRPKRDGLRATDLAIICGAHHAETYSHSAGI
jgi:hypothetical protein